MKKTLEIYGWLIEHGADVNAADFYNRTPIMRAQGEKTKDIIVLLLENGADVNKRDRNGITMLLQAAIDNEEEWAKVLVYYGAKVDLENVIDQMKLDRFNEEKQKQIIEILERNGGLEGKD